MLLEVIARARRRLLWNALVLQLAVAVSTALAVLVLLLLLGTDLVAWTWMIILPAASLAAGGWILRGGLPGASPTAQILDRRLRLADTLSTAWHFAGPHAGRRCAEEFRQAQHAQAASLAATIDLRDAIPMRLPHAMYVSAALAIAATGLFFARYGSEARLDLRAPMAGIVQQLLENTRVEIAKVVDEFRPKISDRPDGKENGKEAGDRESPAGDGENAQGKPPGAGDSNPAGKNSGGQEKQAQEKAVPDTFAGEKEGSEQGNQSSADARSGGQQDAASRPENGGQPQQQQQGTGSQSASASAGSSMVNKIKDSLANLLSAMKPQAGGSGGQQVSKAQDGRQSGNNRKQGAAENGSANGDPGEGGSPQPGNAPSGGTGQSVKAQSDKQQGTGAGRDEGSKEIRAAAQLEAMGKVDRIFGKRAENVSGEFTVEAAPGPQHLSTPYAKRTAEHQSVETVAMRDEVPVAYQDYVKHYYDLLREADATSKRTGRVVAATTRRSRSVR